MANDSPLGPILLAGAAAGLIYLVAKEPTRRVSYGGDEGSREDQLEKVYWGAYLALGEAEKELPEKTTRAKAGTKLSRSIATVRGHLRELSKTIPDRSSEDLDDIASAAEFLDEMGEASLPGKKGYVFSSLVRAHLEQAAERLWEVCGEGGKEMDSESYLEFIRGS